MSSTPAEGQGKAVRQSTTAHRRTPPVPASSSSIGHSSTTNRQSNSNNNNNSLSKSFVHLNRRDVAFFDSVVDLVPQGSTNFADLKRAYNLARSSDELHRRLDQDADAALWDTLLRLTHVRGKSWAHRWDAVRLTLGLEPRHVSEDELSERNTTDDEETPRGQRQILSSADRRFNNRPASWDASTHAGPVRRIRKERRSPTPSSIESPAANAFLRKRQHNSVDKAEIEALQARMASLSAEAASLASNIDSQEGNDNETKLRSSVQRRPILVATNRESERQQQERHLRFASSNDEILLSRATTVESASDDDDLGSRERQKASTSKLSSVRSAATQPAYNASPANMTPAKRRFDEVVARSRSERDALRQAEEAQRDAMEERRLEPAYRLADQVFSDFLRRRCMLWWLALHARQQNRTYSAVQKRDKEQLAKALQAWREKCHRNRTMASEAAIVDDARCKLSTWRTWTRRAHAKRKAERQERHMQLRGAFEVIRGNFEVRITSECFKHWYMQFEARNVERAQTRELMRNMLNVWKKRVNMLTKEQQAARTREIKLKQLAWSCWSDALRTHQLHAIGASYDRQLTLQRYIDRWRHAEQQKNEDRRQVALADRWFARRAKLRVLGLWLERKQDLVSMQEQGQMLLRRQSEARKSTYFRAWVVLERERMLLRVKDTRSTLEAYKMWREKYVKLMAVCKQKAGRVTARRNVALLRIVFTKWHNNVSAAASTYKTIAKEEEGKLLERSVRQWMGVLQRRQQQYGQALVQDSMCLKRNIIGRWIEHRRKRKLEAWEDKHTEANLRNVFKLWRARAAQERWESAAVESIRKKKDIRVCRETFHAWVSFLHRRNAMHQEAVRTHDGALVQKSWQAWMQACLRHDDQLNLGNSFADVKREEWTRRLFATWLHAARRKRSLRERFEHLLHERQGRSLNKVMEQWFDRYAESTLHDQELDCLLLRQESVKRSALLRWKSKTPLLPAIQLHNARVKSHVFLQWRRVMPFARRQRQAMMQDRLVMQCKAFVHWLRLAKAKRAYRAAARFSGHSGVRMRAAHRRVSGGTAASGDGEGVAHIGGPFGSGAGSRPSSRRRSRNSVGQDRLRTRAKSEVDELVERANLLSFNRHSSPSAEWERDFGAGDYSSSLRESDLVVRESASRQGSNLGVAAELNQVQPSLSGLYQSRLGHTPARISAHQTDVGYQQKSDAFDFQEVLRWRQDVRQGPALPPSVPSSASMQQQQSGERPTISEISSEPATGVNSGNLWRRYHVARRPADNAFLRSGLSRGGGGNAYGQDYLQGHPRSPLPQSRTQSDTTIRTPRP